ncbi:hypothetical protein C2S51_022374 [Perilla frutescens var. frutescens]|nr:hypothetical protein C2S51_022374 [Perilla frutescens var. frutescens]
MPKTQMETRVDQIEKGLADVCLALDEQRAKFATLESLLQSLVNEKGIENPSSSASATPPPSTAPTDKVGLALVAMQGDAMYWIQWVLRRFPTLTWQKFMDELLLRFGEDDTVNSYEAMVTTRQTGQFLGGLWDDIRARVCAELFMDVFQAMRWARQAERELSWLSGHRTERQNFRPPPVGNSVPPPSFVARSSRPPANANGRPPGQQGFSGSSSSATLTAPRTRPRGVKYLSPSEYQEHREKSLCFRCSHPYGPLHVCPTKGLAVMIGADDEEGEDSNLPPEPTTLELPSAGDPDSHINSLQLSHLSSQGFDGPRTMKLIGRVGHYRVLTMIDSGVTHCFILERVVEQLGLQIDTSHRCSVVLGNGNRVTAAGICRQVPLYLQSATFPVDCYVFPVGGVDMILGVSWLASLGDVKANWGLMTMEFLAAGRTITLRGDPSFVRRATPQAHVHLLTDIAHSWLLWPSEAGAAPLQLANLAQSSTIEPPSLELEKLLQEFPTVLSPLGSLPLSQLQAVSLPVWVEYDKVQAAVRQDPILAKVIQTLESGELHSQHYALVHGHLFYRGRLVVPRGSEWSQKLIAEFHATPSGGHSGAFRTYRHLAANAMGRLPVELLSDAPEFIPNAILRRRQTSHEGLLVEQVLASSREEDGRLKSGWQKEVEGVFKLAAGIRGLRGNKKN